MKILHLIGVGGGVSVYVRLINQHIDVARYSNIIVHPDEEHFEVTKNISSHSIPIIREIRPLQDFKTLMLFIKIIKKTKPDLLHVHSAKAGIIGRIAGFLMNVPIAYTPHAFSYLSTSNKIKRYIYLILERIFKYTDNYVIATSNSEAQRAIKEVGMSEKKVKIFENCIPPIGDSEIDQSTVDFELPDDYICSIGRPSYQKNTHASLEIFKNLKQSFPNLKFILLGVGLYSPDLEEIQNLRLKYNLTDDFIMIPWMKREQTFNIVKNAKLYISTSRYEGLPYSVIEAMALAKACVLSNCDGNKDLVIDGENGFLVHQDNLIDDMVKSCEILLTDDELRNKMEKSSYKRFMKYFNIETRIENLERIYTQISS